MRAVADTSVIVPAALRSNPAHSACRDALIASRASAAGHAWIESFSVLTRLPADVRLSGGDACQVLDAVVPSTRFLSADEHVLFVEWVRTRDVVGGAIYDALVGWVARCAELPLLTRDVRALPTYRALGVEVLLLDPTMD
jgi:toxin FitB